MVFRQHCIDFFHHHVLIKTETILVIYTIFPFRGLGFTAKFSRLKQKNISSETYFRGFSANPQNAAKVSPSTLSGKKSGGKV